MYVYFLIVVVSLCVWWFKKQSKFWEHRGFLSAQNNFPFGSLKGVGRKITTFENADRIYKRFKGKALVAGTYTFIKPSLMVLDLELVKNILIRDFAKFHDRGFYYNKEDDPASANLLTLEGAEWRERRVKLSPIFTSGKMKSMFDIVDSIGDKMMQVFEKDHAVTSVHEVKELAGKYTADVIGNAAFGLECNCLEDKNSAFFKHSRQVFDRTPLEVIKFLVSAMYPEFCRRLHFGLFNAEASEFFMNTFLETFNYRSKNNIKRNDFVSLLLNYKDQFKPEELAAEGFLVFTGGFESSSTLVTFLMYELAINPKVQSKLREEICSGLKKNNGKLTYDLLCGFKYLDMAAYECLRKYPPFPRVSRKCTQDYEIPDTSLVIPKGTIIEIPSYSMHHDEDIYPEPEKFDPERFTPENVKNRHSMSFLAFGEGSRNCVGLRFGLMQAKVAVIKLISQYEVKPCEKSPIPMKFIPSSPVVAPIGGMFLDFVKVEN